MKNIPGSPILGFRFAAIVMGFLGAITLVLSSTFIVRAWTPEQGPTNPLVRIPGTQPGETVLEGPGRYLNCLANYNTAIEPGVTRQGSMTNRQMIDGVGRCVVAAPELISVIPAISKATATHTATATATATKTATRTATATATATSTATRIATATATSTATLTITATATTADTATPDPSLIHKVFLPLIVREDQRLNIQNDFLPNSDISPGWLGFINEWLSPKTNH